MKICYLADVNNVHPQRIVQHFAKEGHRIEVVSITEPGEPALQALQGRGVQVHYVGPLKTGRKLSLSFAAAHLRALKKTRAVLSSFAPDVLHCLYLTDCGLYGALSGFHPLMIFAMGSDIYLDPQRSALHRRIYRYVLGRADLIHSGSEHAVGRLVADGGRPGGIKVLPYGIDLKKFRPRPRDPSCLASLGLAPQHKIVISARSLQPVYSVDTLIRAIPLVLPSVPEARFLILGKGSLEDELKSLARELGVWDAVRFLGTFPNDEVPRYLNLADLFVSTSLSDVFAHSTMEAMGCGKAVVVTDIPGVEEWVCDGLNGMLFPVQDDLQLAACLVKMLSEPPLMKKMGMLNRRYMEDKGDLSVAMRAIDEEYRELSARAAQARG